MSETSTRVLGIITGLKGSEIAASTIVMQNSKVTTSINKNAEAYNEDGACTDDAVISIKTTLTFDGFVNGTINIVAGTSTVTYKTKLFIVDTAELTGTAGQYQTFSVTAHRTDEATPGGLVTTTP